MHKETMITAFYQHKSSGISKSKKIDLTHFFGFLKNLVRYGRNAVKRTREKVIHNAGKLMGGIKSFHIE